MIYFPLVSGLWISWEQQFCFRTARGWGRVKPSLGLNPYQLPEADVQREATPEGRALPHVAPELPQSGLGLL